MNNNLGSQLPSICNPVTLKVKEPTVHGVIVISNLLIIQIKLVLFLYFFPVQKASHCNRFILLIVLSKISWFSLHRLRFHRSWRGFVCACQMSRSGALDLASGVSGKIEKNEVLSAVQKYLSFNPPLFLY